MNSKFKIKPYEESIELSEMVNLYNTMAKYINPETLLEITEELVHIYSILPEYFDSELPGIVVDAIIDLGMKKNPAELLFQTVGDLSVPFQKKLEFLGFEPIHYTWSMYLDDFDLFVNPGIPPGIKIDIQNEIEDFSVVDVINEAFDGSFKFKPLVTTVKNRNNGYTTISFVDQQLICRSNNNFIYDIFYIYYSLHALVTLFNWF